MTASAPAYRRDVAQPPGPAILLPATGVRGEIKPHHAAGIRAGLVQLLRAPRNTRRILVTYRTVTDADPTRFEVLLADPAEVSAALRVLATAPAGQVRLARWYRIGGFTAPQATRRIPLWACPTALGVALEPQVREAYRRFLHRSGHSVALPPRSAHHGGHDLVHEELADFLGELANALAAAGRG